MIRKSAAVDLSHMRQICVFRIFYRVFSDSKTEGVVVNC